MWNFRHFARNLREFGVPVARSEELEVNQWILLDIHWLSSQSESAKNTIHKKECSETILSRPAGLSVFSRGTLSFLHREKRAIILEIVVNFKGSSIKEIATRTNCHGNRYYTTNTLKTWLTDTFSSFMMFHDICYIGIFCNDFIDNWWMRLRVRKWRIMQWRERGSGGGWPKLNAEVIHRDLHDSPYYTKAEFIQNLFDHSFKI